MAPHLFASAAAIVVGAAAAFTDARSGRIPNWLTLPAAALGLLSSALIGGAEGAILSALGLVASAAVPWLMHRATRGQAIGGGDVKLFAALGALLGPTGGLQVELSACVLVAVFAVVKLAFAGRLLRVLGNAAYLLVRPILPKRWHKPLEPEALTTLRMGPAIAVAVVSVACADQLARWVPWLVG